MNIDIVLVLISICLSLFGSYNYIRDTIKGTTRPSIVSQSLWSIAPLIGAGAAISSGAGFLTTVRIFMAGLTPLVILLATFANRNGYWRTTKFDYFCGLFSIIAIVLWLVIDLPIYAIIFAVIADLFASIPTIKKSITNPESETGIDYIMSILSVLIIIPTIKTFDIQNTAFQIYMVCVNLIIVFSIYRNKIFRNYAK